MRHGPEAVLSPSTTVRLGPLLVRINGPEPAIRAVRRQYSGFGAQKTARSEIEIAVSGVEQTGPELSGEIPQQTRTSSGETILQTATYRAHISADGRQAALEGAGWGEGLAATMQQAAARRLVERQGLLVHAALLRWGRGTALFVGPSGAGKTTLARHAEDLALCDELAVVLREGGHLVAHATPYHQGRRGRGRLAAIFLLARGPGCTAEPMAGPAALRELLPQLVLADPERQADAALAGAAALLEQAPARRLAFRPGKALRAFLQAQDQE